MWAILLLFTGWASADCKVYQKDQTYYSSLLATVKDSKVYKKDQTYYSSLLFTIKDGKAYKKDQTYYSSLLLTGKDCSNDQVAAAAVALLAS